MLALLRLLHGDERAAKLVERDGPLRLGVGERLGEIVGGGERVVALPARPIEAGCGLVLRQRIALRLAQRPDLGLADPHGAIDCHQQPPEALARIGDRVGVPGADSLELVRGRTPGDGLAGPALLLRDLASEFLVSLLRRLRPGDAGRKGG